MKLDYNDLLQFLSDKPSKELLSEKLFQLGHEHEINGNIFDMELTPNRGDCISLKGLARDLNIFFGTSKEASIYNADIETLDFEFENLSPKDCPKISFLEIEIEGSIKEYQPYLKNYFDSLGNNKTNFFTDISNYISYEQGQPTHCYESEAINNKLTFENRKCDEKFNTLLNSEINLDGYNCIFSMGNDVVNLAGIMGGKSTACSPQTKKVLIECAYFNPESIIGKSVKYNLNSDAAHKFERGVDISSQNLVLRRFAKIVQDHAKIKKVKFKSFSYREFKSTYIPVDVNKINKILGTSIEQSKYIELLCGLGFEIKDQIKVPSYRHDIKTNNDLAEEIARLIGYNNIKSIPFNLKKVYENEDDKLRKLESFLTRNGFNEVINFPFTSKKEKESIKIDNPLDSNKKNLRTSLVDSLIENLLYNERRQKDSIKLFEISDIYKVNSEISQEKRLGIIVSGRSGHNYEEFSKSLNYKYLNQLLNQDLDHDVFKVVEIQRSSLNTKKKDKIFYVEVSLNEIPDKFFLNLGSDKKTINFVCFNPVSEYPSSTRDFSFSIDNLSNVNEVINLLDGVSDKMIKHSFIFDFYKNNKIDTVKLGYRFIFQSSVKTLSDDDINKKIKEIIDPILALDGVSIPGM